MSVTTGDLIQLLQLIVLAFTAVVFISQFILRFFLSEDVTKIIESSGKEQAMDQLTNGVKMFFLSIVSFMVGGSVISVYLALVGAPDAVAQIMATFEANTLLIGIAILAALAIIAVYIGGDYENPHTGTKRLIMAAVLTGGISVMIIVIYVTLWAATQAEEWIFFIGALSVAVAMFTLLFGALTLSEVLLDVIEEVAGNTSASD